MGLLSVGGVKRCIMLMEILLSVSTLPIWSVFRGEPAMAAHKCKKCGEPLTLVQSGLPCPICGSTDRIVTDGDQAVAMHRAAVARELARKHYEVEAGLTRVFLIADQAQPEGVRSEPIKLLEVNADTVASGIMPLHFGPAPASGIPYPSIIIEVTPEEFDKIHSNEMKLPEGWKIGEELPRP